MTTSPTPGARAAPTLTFVFTDLEGSTPMWERHPDVMAAQLAEHDRLIAAVVARFGGELFTNTGDGVGIAFPDALASLGAAVELQRQMRAQPWNPECRLAMRIGLHTGVADRRDGNYFGRPLNRTARITSAGHGHQILASEETVRALAAPLPSGLTFEALGEHRLKGIAERVAIHQVVAEGLPARFPPLRSLDPLRHTIPVPVSRLIGRERELEDVSGLVREHRLVSIIAPGGSGKTRLSVEVAAASSTWAHGGVHVVELASVQRGDQLLRAITDVVLGPEPMPVAGGDIRRLVERVDDTTLVVVDNCEHLIDDCADVVEELIGSCRHLRVLATSREALRLPGEVVYPLAPLPLTADDGGLSVAAELFCERARAVAPTAELSDAAAIEELCGRLDGLPLAIELAASRLNSFSLADVAARLFEVLAQPTRRGRSAARHGTIEAAIRWSYDMLTPDEQELLARLSVFAGSFDRTAAETVCGDERRSASDVLRMVTSLVEKSLLSTTRTEFGLRLQLLHLVRNFAAERLGEFGGRGDLQRRHAKYYVSLAFNSMGAIESATDTTLVTRLSADDANFTVVLDQDQQAGDVRTARKLALALHTYWEESGRLRDGVLRLRRLLEPRAPDDLLWVATLNVCASYHAMCGMLADADELFAMVREGAEQAGPLASGAHLALGFEAIAQADMPAAIRHFETAASALADFDPPGAREALMIAGTCASFLPDASQAAGYFARARAVSAPEPAWFALYADVMEQSAGLIEGTGDPARLAHAVAGLAELHLAFRISVAVPHAFMAFARVGRYDLVERYLATALEPPRRSGHLWSTLLGLSAAAWVAAVGGEHERAAMLWGVVDGAALRAHYRPVPIVALIEAPLRLAVVRALGDAMESHTEAGKRRDVGSVVDDLLAQLDH